MNEINRETISFLFQANFSLRFPGKNYITQLMSKHHNYVPPIASPALAISLHIKKVIYVALHLITSLVKPMYPRGISLSQEV